MSQQLLYTAEQVRQLDAVTIDDFAVPGIVLMTRAGRAVFELLLQQWPQVTVIEGREHQREVSRWCALTGLLCGGT